MNFKIEIYHNGPKVGFYSVFVENEEVCETDQFLNRFKDIDEFKDDIATIRAEIRNMGKFGAHPERFRPEDNCNAIPIAKKRTPDGQIKVLRLYCIRCSQETVILCGGGLKISKRVQDSPDAYFHFKRAKQIEKLYREKIINHEIQAVGKFLYGDLEFIDFYST